MKHVFIIAQAFEYSLSGIQTYLSNIVTNLKDVTITIFCSYSKNNYYLDHPIVRCEKKKSGYFESLYYFTKLLIFHPSNRYISLKLLFLLAINRNIMINTLDRLKSTIQSIRQYQKPDYSIASLVVPDGVISIILKLKFGVPAIVLLHGSELIHFVGNKRYLELVKLVFKHADIIIPNSNFMHVFLKKFYQSEDNVFINKLGVDTNLFKRLPKMLTINKKYNISDKKKIILSVSNIVRNKGLDVLIKAMKFVLKEFSDVHLQIVGGNENFNFKNELVDLIQKLNLEEYISWLGEINHLELPNYYSSADFVVLPSRWEGFGLVTIEANACGKPVIGSSVGGNKETIINHETGLLFESENEKDLAEKILTLLRDDSLTKRLSNSAYKRVISEYSWKHVIERLQNEVVRRLNELKN